MFVFVRSAVLPLECYICIKDAVSASSILVIDLVTVLVPVLVASLCVIRLTAKYHTPCDLPKNLSMDRCG